MAEETKSTLPEEQAAAVPPPPPPRAALSPPPKPLPSASDPVHHPAYSGRRHRIPPGNAALTRRALAMGIVLVAFVAAFTPYNDYVLRNSPFIGNHFPISVVSIMIIFIALWNPALRAGAKYPTLPGAIVGTGLAVVTLFILHTSEFVLTLLEWFSHWGFPQARTHAEHLMQESGKLFLVNLAVTTAIVILAHLLRRPRRWLHRLQTPFDPGELIVMMTMMLIGAAAPASGLIRYLEPMLVMPFWQQRQYPWFAEITALFPHWLVPSTDPNGPIVTGYWLGIDPVRGERVPFLAFLIPLLLWGILIAAIMGAGMFLAAIFRKQWVHHERLTYPLATIPLELMAIPEPGRRYNALWRNSVLWAGAAIPLFVYLLAGLHARFPNVPQIDLHYQLRPSFSEAPWNALPEWIVDARLYFAAVGICFFIPSEVAFSLWLFVLLNGFMLVFFSRFEPARHEVTRSMGIYVAYFAGLLWLARGHLRLVITAAWQRKPRADDEPLSYRTMLGGWLICICVAWLWLMLAGMNWLMAALLLAVGTMLITLMARIVTETGLFWVGPSFWPKEMFSSLLGRGIVSAKSFFWTEVMSPIFYGDLRENIMPYTANSLRMAQDLKETPQGGKAKWFRWLGVALIVSILVSGVVTHYLSYTHGGSSLDEWAKHKRAYDAMQDTYVFSHTTPDTSFANSWGHFIAGAFMVIGLMVGRIMWAGWPLHPIGLVLMNSGPMQTLWFSIFIGWGLKRLLLRYGGAGAFRRARPFFIGLIMGEVLAAGIWMIIGLLTHGTLTYTVLPG